MERCFVCLVFLTIFISHCLVVHSANIVFYFALSTYSHRIPAWPLVEALADQGHNVTFVSPFPSKSPNPKVNDYVPKKFKEWVDSWGDLEDVFENRKMDKEIDAWLILPEFGIAGCDVMYSDNEFVNWVKDSKVDLIFIDGLYNDCAYGMAAYWNAKLIHFQTSTNYPWIAETSGLADETNWIPDMVVHYSLPMTFMQRVKNALSPLAWNLHRRWRYFPYLEQLTKDKLQITNLTPFEEIERGANLVFVNTHYSEEFARSLSPNVVAIGGIALKDKKSQLPKELEDFLKTGSAFIYVSFGTYADFNRMDTSVQQAIIGAFRSFPNIQFIWKVGNDSLVNEFPDRNVHIGSWMPQQEILAHPKIKAFITHAGLLGIQEAVYNAVPLISFPIFADQDYNAERIHRKEYGVRLEITTVTQAQLEDAINRVLNDPKYRENMKRVSTFFKDRPQKPLETALWWTNFVLRHSQDELAGLRPLSSGQYWWKKRQLDVWVAILVVVVLSCVLPLYILLKISKSLCFGSSKNDMLSNKKKMQ